jgi:ribonuclease III
MSTTASSRTELLTHAAALVELQTVIGYRFTDVSLLSAAMAHRSWCAEIEGGHASNERLEFLGDAVLGLVVADHVYRTQLGSDEGRLTDLRKSVVNATALAGVARQIGLGRFVLLGKGEAAGGGADKTSILSDALEAVFGAVYLDGGPEQAAALILGLLGGILESAFESADHLDYKTALQELAARRSDPAPIYDIVEDGPDHDKRFWATARIGSRSFGRGEGRTKKQAEQQAARAALDMLRQGT